jgi:5-methyltetrahydrofolate--homocysteine methyltransferase
MRKYVGLVSILSKPIGGLPVCIDSSDPVTKQSGLEAYYQTAMDPTVKLPIINSINIIDPEPILNLKKDYDFNVIAMLHDRIDKDGNPKNVETADEVHQLAREFFCRLLLHNFKPDNIFFDTAVIPIATDIEATSTYKTLNGIKKIMTDPEMSGVHTVIGLSNCSHMMPNRIAVNRAYLEVAMEFGLDTAVLDPTINYGLKPAGNQVSGIISDLAGNDGSDPIKGFEIFERIADYSRKYGKVS